MPAQANQALLAPEGDTSHSNPHFYKGQLRFLGGPSGGPTGVRRTFLVGPLEGPRHAKVSTILWENFPGAAGRQKVQRGYLALTAGQSQCSSHLAPTCAGNLPCHNATSGGWVMWTREEPGYPQIQPLEAGHCGYVGTSHAPNVNTKLPKKKENNRARRRKVLRIDVRKAVSLLHFNCNTQMRQANATRKCDTQPNCSRLPCR